MCPSLSNVHSKHDFTSQTVNRGIHNGVSLAVDSGVLPLSSDGRQQRVTLTHWQLALLLEYAVNWCRVCGAGQPQFPLRHHLRHPIRAL